MTEETSSATTLEDALAQAESYDQWRAAAETLDRAEGFDTWRREPKSDDYDHRLLTSRVRLLNRFIRDNDLDHLVFHLREELHGNLGNMANPALYRHAHAGTKTLINRYLDSVTRALNLLTDSDVDLLPPMRKRRFLKRAARSFGRSALLLSGGGALGFFHLGVIDALRSEHLLPRVLAGSSAGSIFASVIGTHTDEELDELLAYGNVDFEWFRLHGFLALMRGESALDQRTLKQCIENNIPDMTFLEAYEHTGRILNITVSPTDPHQFPRLLNYLSAPNVLIRWAALASSSIPGLLPPVQLRARNFEGRSVPYMPQSRWIDGSLYDDIPKEKVSRLHNVNHYLVSQTNPHVVPFLSEEARETGVLPFLQEVAIKGPMVQLEHLLEVTRRHFDVPGLNSLIKKSHAIVRQSYSGDITLFPAQSLGDVTKIFSNATAEEVSEMLDAGRRASWPAMERIRNTTQISRTFDDCLRRLESRYRWVRR